MSLIHFCWKVGDAIYLLFIRFVWSGVNVSTRRKANLLQLVMYYLHKYIDIDNTIVSAA